MFSPENRQNLINELNTQLENGTFYSLNNPLNITEQNDDFDSLENIGKPAFANLAKITNFEDDNIMNSQYKDFTISNSYCDSNNFKSVGLYRPLVCSDFNPLNKNVYNYGNNNSTVVHRMAFQKQDGGIIENPILNVQDNVESCKQYVSKPDTSNTKIDGILIKPVELNTYSMSDIFEKNANVESINFSAIPQNLALTKQSKIRRILFKDIDVIGGIKNLFRIKNKI